jgi:hypothetical protein
MLSPKGYCSCKLILIGVWLCSYHTFSLTLGSACNDRRTFLARVAITTAIPFVPPAAVANAAAAPPSEVNSIANLSVNDAKKRFQAAQKELHYLLDHYGEISSKGGDAVRNYLGTQGVNTNMYGIQKVLKILKEEADDIVDYTETMDEFNAYLYQAEGAAYQSMFAEHSSAKSTPESLLATAKQDIVQLVKYMDELAVQLSL